MSSLIALFSALGLFCFNAGTSLALWSWSRLLEQSSQSHVGLGLSADSYDSIEETSLAALLAGLGWRWTSVNALVCLCGFLGALLNKSRLLRVFAAGSTIDIILFAFVFFVVFLLTVSPTLSPTFASVLCGELTRGEIFGFARYFSESQTSGPASGPILTGIEILSYGVENCEEHWRSVMLVLMILGAAGCSVRIWTLAMTCRHITRLEAKEIDDEAWRLEADEKLILRERARRSSSLSRHRPAPGVGGRAKSASISTPQLVLVPVFYDSARSAAISPTKTSSPPHSPRLATRCPSPTGSSTSTVSTHGPVNGSRRLKSKRRLSAPPVATTMTTQTSRTTEGTTIDERVYRTRTRSDGCAGDMNV